MNRKQKKEQKRLLSTRQLMGIDQFTENGLKAGRSELVYFLIQPDNLSVLSGEGVRGRVMALTNLLRSRPTVRLLALDSRESFQSNKDWYRRRMEAETLPALRELLRQDGAHLDAIQASWTARGRRAPAASSPGWRRASGTKASTSAAPGSRTSCACWRSTTSRT